MARKQRKSRGGGKHTPAFSARISEPLRGFYRLKMTYGKCYAASYWSRSPITKKESLVEQIKFVETAREHHAMSRTGP